MNNISIKTFFVGDHFHKKGFSLSFGKISPFMVSKGKGESIC